MAKGATWSTPPGPWRTVDVQGGPVHWTLEGDTPNQPTRPTLRRGYYCVFVVIVIVVCFFV